MDRELILRTQAELRQESDRLMRESYVIPAGGWTQDAVIESLRKTIVSEAYDRAYMSLGDALSKVDSYLDES